MRTTLLASLALMAATPAFGQESESDAEPTEQATPGSEGDDAADPSTDDPAAPEETGPEASEPEPEASSAPAPPSTPSKEAVEDAMKSILEEAAVTEPEPEPEIEAEIEAEPTPPRVAHGAAVDRPADRVGKKPNQALLYTAGGLAAATAVTYGLAVNSYAEAFSRQPRPYEDFDRIRQRTNTLTAISGGLAAATLGTGISAFVVGEF